MADKRVRRQTGDGGGGEACSELKRKRRILKKEDGDDRNERNLERDRYKKDKKGLRKTARKKERSK